MHASIDPVDKFRIRVRLPGKTVLLDHRGCRLVDFDGNELLLIQRSKEEVLQVVSSDSLGNSREAFPVSIRIEGDLLQG